MIVTETERLILRHLHRSDGAAMDRVFGDAKVMFFGPGTQNRTWVRNWLRECRENYSERGFGPWAIVEKSLGSVIGYCGLFYFPDIDGRPEIEIGYRLARPFWGRGYATEAALAVRDDGFTRLAIPRLIALIAPQNKASIRVAEKLGMQYEKDIMLEGYTYPDYLYSLERNGYETLSKAPDR